MADFYVELDEVKGTKTGVAVVGRIFGRVDGKMCYKK